ncbi:MAG: tRNA (adenosine(37)-N6)-threonylcarbamoyltransferase complex ATPase subunit type 1 TsaE [Acidimicrobiales bacterium]|jgi:tRNA threonylcarbamoyladenosine biosynthesis protein TsaE
MIPSTLTTVSPGETRAAGELFAEALEPGDVVLLVGELGAGKTTFVQGVAAGLGVTDDVTSPTFTLCQVYQGRLTVLHADLWRLERLQEVVDLALDEGLEEGGVLLAEWGEGAVELYGDDALVVSFDLGETESDRVLRLEAHGPRWERRVEAAR